MSVLFKPGLSAGSRWTGAAGSPHPTQDADARRFVTCLATPHSERDARDSDDGARRRRLSVARAAAARIERLDARPGGTAGELTWRLTVGRFAGFVVHAHIQQHTLYITLIPANAGQRALAARHRVRIEAACAVRFAGPTVVTWHDAADCA